MCNRKGVLQVAVQLADALAAAHALGIVHRDVKPANILFPRLDNEIWLSDFGICHIGTAPEGLTETGEVVGPRGFTAPELEFGGSATVTGSADIYSLGKVIYYMLSGGRLIAREHLDTTECNTVFGKGERYSILRALLLRMIAPLERRISLVSEVAQELRRIQQWEEYAHTLPLSERALSMIIAAQQKAIDQDRIKKKNEEVRQDTQRLIEAAGAGILEWLNGEITKTAAFLEVGGVYKTEIKKASWIHSSGPIFKDSSRDMYGIVDGIELIFVNILGQFQSQFVLKCFICKASRQIIQNANNMQPVKPTDPQMAFVPYVVELKGPTYTESLHGGFIKSKETVVNLRKKEMERRGGRINWHREPLIDPTFIGSPINLLVMFKASEWSGAIEHIKTVFSEAVERIVEFSAKDSSSVGA